MIKVRWHRSFLGSFCRHPLHLTRALGLKGDTNQTRPLMAWRKQVAGVSLMGLALNPLADCVPWSQFSSRLIYIENESL